MWLFESILTKLFSTIIHCIENLGAAVCFLLEMIFSIFRTKNLSVLLKEQFICIGCWPFIVTTLSAVCMGGVLFLQAYRALFPFRLEGQLPLFIALPLIREFAPVLSAWLLSGVVGSALTAETGLMKATEQLLSLELMGIDPIGQIFLCRFLSFFVLLPLMIVIFVIIGLIASAEVGLLFFSFDAGHFLALCWQEVQWRDELLRVVIKTAIFSTVVGWISLFTGFNAIPNSEGVSQATTRGVTLSLLAVLFFDLLCTVCTKESV